MAVFIYWMVQNAGYHDKMNEGYSILDKIANDHAQVERPTIITCCYKLQGHALSEGMVNYA